MAADVSSRGHRSSATLLIVCVLIGLTALALLGRSTPKGSSRLSPATTASTRNDAPPNEDVPMLSLLPRTDDDAAAVALDVQRLALVAPCHTFRDAATPASKVFEITNITEALQSLHLTERLKAWRWSHAEPAGTAPPQRGRDPWHLEFDREFTKEHTVNFLRWYLEPGIPFTRNLTLVDPQVAFVDLQPPFPVRWTAHDFTDMRSPHVAEVVIFGDRVLVETYLQAIAVEVSTGMVVDVSNEYLGIQGHGSGTLPIKRWVKYLANMYVKTVATMQGRTTAWGAIETLPPPQGGYYIYGVHKGLAFPGHILDTVTHAFSTHRTDGTNTSLIMEQRYVPHAFVKWVLKYYPVHVVGIENERFYRCRASFVPVLDTGHSPAAFQFVAEAVVPKLLQWWRNATPVRKAIMMKMRGIGNFTVPRVPIHAGSRKTWIPPGERGHIIYGPKFEELALRHGWSFVPPSQHSYDYRAFVTNTAEVIMLSWGGTMATQVYAYGNQSRPLRLILLLPPDRYDDEFLQIGHVFNGRGDLRVWYRTGWETRQYEMPAVVKYIRIAVSAEELTDEDVEWQTEPFEIVEWEAPFWRHWGVEAREHELLSRRLRLFNRMGQSNAALRRAARDAVSRAVLDAFSSGDKEASPSLAWCDGRRIRAANAGRFGAEFGGMTAQPPCELPAGTWVATVVNGIPAIASRVLHTREGDDSAASRSPKSTVVVCGEASPFTSVLVDAGVVNRTALDAFRDGLRVLSEEVRAMDDVLTPAPPSRNGRVTRFSLWLGGALPASRGLYVQALMQRLGHYVMHGYCSDPQRPLHVLATRSGGTAEAVAMDSLLEAVVAAVLGPSTSVQWVDGGALLRDNATTALVVAPLIPAWTPSGSAGQFAAARHAVERSALAATRESALRPVALLGTWPEAAPVLPAASVKRLASVGFDVHFDLSPTATIQLFATVAEEDRARDVLVVYGDAMHYYLSLWAPARPSTPPLRVIVLCPTQHHFTCGLGLHGQRRFFDFGMEMGLRHVEIKFVLVTATMHDFTDADVSFEWWMPSNRAVMRRVWGMEQQSEDETRRIEDRFTAVMQSSLRSGSNETASSTPAATFPPVPPMPRV